MIAEALLVANLAMLSVFACRSIQATKAELRLREYVKTIWGADE